MHRFKVGDLIHNRQTNEDGKRRITILEQMREIEGELSLLAARSDELDFENGHRFKRLFGNFILARGEMSRDCVCLGVGAVIWVDKSPSPLVEGCVGRDASGWVVLGLGCRHPAWEG